MDSVINDPYMVKNICSFLDYDDKKEFTLISKIIYNASKLVYHDFIYDIKRFDILPYEYKLRRVRKIKNYNGEIIESKILENMYTVTCNTDIKDISMLGNIHILNLSSCRKIKDVSMLGNVHTLDLSFTDIKDVSMLGNVHILNLNGCKNITDISSLGNIHTLDLRWCKNIKGVSKLGDDHTLNLSKTDIKDVSMLGNVHTLDLYGCKNITDVSMLCNVHKLDLYGHKNITDISTLGNVNTLYIDKDKYDLTCLENVNIKYY